jgi:hypothetical protein
LRVHGCGFGRVFEDTIRQYERERWSRNARGRAQEQIAKVGGVALVQIKKTGDVGERDAGNFAGGLYLLAELLVTAIIGDGEAAIAERGVEKIDREFLFEVTPAGNEIDGRATERKIDVR